MQQDWKAIWDNLNPDEAAKERMKQAILQKIQAETPQTASKKSPFFLQRCSFGTFARAAALCCMTVTVALAGLHLTDRRTAELLPAPSVSEQPTIRQRTADGNDHTAYLASTDNNNFTSSNHNENTDYLANNRFRSKTDGYCQQDNSSTDC